MKEEYSNRYRRWYDKDPVLSEAVRTLEETDEIIIAGVLGSCLHPANAVQIGLLPKADGDKMCFAGNAAGQGAVAVMLDEKFAEKLEKLARKIQHIELAQEPDFQEKLLNAMNFEGWF